MSLKQQIDSDLKTALLSGDKSRASTLRTLKSVILNTEIADNKRETGLGDAEIISLLQKEAKKRQESAGFFNQGGSPDRAEAELAEKTIIESYLPPEISKEEVTEVVDRIIAESQASGMQAMGQVIGKVKQELGPAADGALIAQIVKERLT